MQDYFSDALDFIESDNRQHRPRTPVNLEYMTKKHRALFPDASVRGKTILDLGSCLGSTGHWCLAAGASHYRGVEVQHTYVELSKTLLAKYHPSSTFSIVESAVEPYIDTQKEQFDIVSALGIIYGFTDYYSFLRSISLLARESIVIEGLYHNKEKFGDDFSGVEFIDNQTINLADVNASALGRGTRISPKGLAWIMTEFGFGESELLKPEPIINSVDIYNTNRRSKDLVRYMMWFKRTDVTAESLSGKLQHNRIDKTAPW
jgi:hypothetical protein